MQALKLFSYRLDINNRQRLEIEETIVQLVARLLVDVLPNLTKHTSYYLMHFQFGWGKCFNLISQLVCILAWGRHPHSARPVVVPERINI